MRQLVMKKNCQICLRPLRSGSIKSNLLFVKRIFAAFFALSITMLAVFPQELAYAKYENLSITGIAQVKTNASLHVTEQRAFAFDEAYSAIEWNVPGIQENSTISVSSVRALQANKKGKSTGKWRAFKEVPFNQSWRDMVSETGGETHAMSDYFNTLSSSDTGKFAIKPKSRTYSYDSSNDRIYIFPKSVKKTTVYECNYNITNALSVYDDVAELYWTYSNPIGDEEAKDLHMKIQLPVPDNADVRPNDNVFAWGHGPEGSLEIRTDGVIDIKVPQVKAGQYSMVHVVFPRSWLRNVNMNSEICKTGTRLGNAVSEEENWTDTNSVYQMNAYGIGIAILILCFVALIVSVVLYIIFGREKSPSELNETCLGNIENDADDVYSLDNRAENCMGCETAIRAVNPAVCGRLLRWNHHSAYDLAYVLQKLIDEGAVQTTFSSDVDKIRLSLVPSSKNIKLDEIEQEALYLFFEAIGDGRQSISIEDIRKYCSKNPKAAYDIMRNWQDIVSRQVDEANVFDRKSRHASYFVYGIAAFLALVGIGILVQGFAFWGALATFIAAIACVAIAYNIPRRTQAGVDLANKLENCAPLRSAPRPIWEEPLANAFEDALTA